MNQDEIAKKLHTKQYRISRLLKELDEVVSKELLDNGGRNIYRELFKLSQQYFETKFLPFYHERMEKKHIEFASKELGIHFVKENDSRSIAKQIETAISKLPAKERKQWVKKSDK